MTYLDHSAAQGRATASRASSRIVGSGEMASRIRSHAWEKTPLGSIDSWPVELVVMVNHLLSSRLIACIVWGDEQTLLYNDLYEPLLGFDGEIRQVLNNIVGNAIDAMQARGGRLLVRSRTGTDWATGARGVVLTIADTGEGISTETRRRLFEAFHTTKGINGNGLGLWVSKEIVERHNGFLRVRSSTTAGASGTVFTIFLPFELAAR